MGRNKSIKFGLFLFLIINLCRFYFSMDTDLSKSNLSITIISAFVVSLVFVFYRDDCKLLRGNYLKFPIIFSVGFLIVHYFEYLGYIIGDHHFLISSEFYNKNHINESAIFALCSYIAYTLGYIFKVGRTNYSKGVSNIHVNGTYLHILLPLSLILFFYFADKRYFMQGGNYIVSNTTGLSPLCLISQVIFLASQGLYSISKIFRYSKVGFIEYVKSYSLLFYYIPILIYLFLILQSGDRGPIFYICLSYIIPFFVINKKKLRFTTAILALIIGAFSLHFLGILRNVSGEITISKIEETNIEIAERSNERNIVFESTSDLSNVVRAYNVLYDYTEQNGCVYGLAFVERLSGIIPGFRSYILYPLLGIKNANFLSTGHISTRLMGEDHGMGTTCVADAYFNFGFIGTLLLFFAFGMLSRLFDICLYYKKMNTFMYITSFWFFAYAIYIGRASFLDPVSYCGYSYMIYFLTNRFSKSSQKQLVRQRTIV